MSVPGEQTTMSEGLLLAGLTVVIIRDGNLAPDTAVLVENGKIARIAPTTSLTDSESTHQVR